MYVVCSFHLLHACVLKSKALSTDRLRSLARSRFGRDRMHAQKRLLRPVVRKMDGHRMTIGRDAQEGSRKGLRDIVNGYDESVMTSH